MPSLKPLFIVTILEAISWIGLLVAMIVKYGFDNPRGVEVMGPIHGTLFIVFVVVLAFTHIQRKWPISKTLLAFVESVPPFTGFLLAKQLRDEMARETATAT